MEPDLGSWQSPDISRSHLYRGTIAWTPSTAIYRAYTVMGIGCINVKTETAKLLKLNIFIPFIIVIYFYRDFSGAFIAPQPLG